MSDTTDRMQDCARAIQVVLPPGTGFVILAFDFNQSPDSDARLDYISNAKREDVIKVMEAFISKTDAPESWGKHL